MYTHLVPDRRIRATIKPTLGERNRTNTLTASTDKFKVIETIDDRVGGYNFLPTLIASCSRRKQCPLHLVNSESSLLGCAGSDRYSKDWSPSSLRARHHKPNDSARVGTGQSSFRGRVRCQSLFIAGERRRCEPGSNSVIVTNTLTSVEGHVLRLGGVLRTRKIFVGCPAIRPIWDQSPGIRNPRFETVGNRLYPYTIKIASAVPRRRRKSKIVHAHKTGPNTAPGFLRVSRRRSRALQRHSRAGGNPEKNKARRSPPSRSARGPKRPIQAKPKGPTRERMMPGDGRGARVSTPSSARSVCPPRHLPACAGTTVVSKSSPRAGIAPTNG